MELDKRNPFAAWGFEEEKYSVSGEEGKNKFEVKDYTSLVDPTNTDLFVNDGELPERAGEFNVPQDEAFFTNNENSVNTLYLGKRMVAGEDIVYNTNEELPMYGIIADDLRDKNASSESEEGSEEETEVEGGNEEATDDVEQPTEEDNVEETL